QCLDGGERIERRDQRFLDAVTEQQTDVVAARGEYRTGHHLAQHRAEIDSGFDRSAENFRQRGRILGTDTKLRIQQEQALFHRVENFRRFFLRRLDLAVV